MAATPRPIEHTRGIRISTLGLLIAAAVCLARPPVAAAQNLLLSTHRLYLVGDTLRVDLALDSLFSARSLDAIASGMTTSIEVELRLEARRGFRPRQRTVRALLIHDIWEGRYQAIRHGSVADTLATTDFEVAESFCSGLSGVTMGPVPGDDTYVLRTRVSVNPISEDQRLRTRSWLNFLEKGSILELFFSLDTPIERSEWLEVERFRREDLQ